MNRISSIATTFLAPIFVMVAAAGLGLEFGSGALGGKFLVVILFAIVVSFLIFNVQYRWPLYLMSVASIAIGHHGIYIGRSTFLLPMEIITLLLSLFALSGIKAVGKSAFGQVPADLMVFTLLILLRAFVGFLLGDGLDDIGSWVIPFAFGPPIFFVSSYFLRSMTEVRTAIRVFFLATIPISALASLEYFVPGAKTRLPFIFVGTGAYVAQDGFVRAGFSAWGYTAVASIVTCGVLIGYSELLHPRFGIRRFISIPGIAIGLVAIYISGERISWISLAVGFLVLTITYSRQSLLPGTVISTVAISTASLLLPSAFWTRFDTLSEVSSGTITDTSALSRIARWTWALSATVTTPFWGLGYTHWLIHNVFLEISSSVGIVPMVIFIVFIVRYIFRIIHLIRTPGPASIDGWLLAALGINWMLIMMLETPFTIPPYAVTQWLMLAIGWQMCQLYRNPQSVAESRTSQSIIEPSRTAVYRS